MLKASKKSKDCDKTRKRKRNNNSSSDSSSSSSEDSSASSSEGYVSSGSETDSGDDGVEKRKVKNKYDLGTTVKPFTRPYDFTLKAKQLKKIRRRNPTPNEWKHLKTPKLPSLLASAFKAASGSEKTEDNKLQERTQHFFHLIGPLGRLVTQAQRLTASARPSADTVTAIQEASKDALMLAMHQIGLLTRDRRHKVLKAVHVEDAERIAKKNKCTKSLKPLLLDEERTITIAKKNKDVKAALQLFKGDFTKAKQPFRRNSASGRGRGKSGFSSRNTYHTDHQGSSSYNTNSSYGNGGGGSFYNRGSQSSKSTSYHRNDSYKRNDHHYRTKDGNSNSSRQ